MTAVHAAGAPRMLTPMQQKILDAVRAGHKRPYSIAKHIGSNDNAVSVHLHRMIRLESPPLRRTGRGTYGLPETSEQ